MPVSRWNPSTHAHCDVTESVIPSGRYRGVTVLSCEMKRRGFRYKRSVPVNKRSLFSFPWRRCVSHAPSWRAERWFWFSFVIVGSRGRRGGSTTGSDGANSLSASFRRVICPNRAPFCGVPLRGCIALVQAQDTDGHRRRRCEGVKTRASKLCIGTCNYGDLIDTLFTDVEGVAESAAFYRWFSLKRFVVSVLPPTCMVLELSDWIRKNQTLSDRA